MARLLNASLRVYNGCEGLVEEESLPLLKVISMRGEGVGEGREVVGLAVHEHVDDVAIHDLFDVRVVVLPPREPHLTSLQLIPLTL